MDIVPLAIRKMLMLTFLQLYSGILHSDWLKTVVNETTPFSSA